MASPIPAAVRRTSLELPTWFSPWLLSLSHGYYPCWAGEGRKVEKVEKIVGWLLFDKEMRFCHGRDGEGCNFTDRVGD